jgi:SNF2 family DNA or RNA helicase
MQYLPPVSFQLRRSALTKEQTKHYKAMHKNLVMQVGKVGTEITAQNAAVKLLKLLQVTTGAVYDEFGIPFEIDASYRLKVLEELVEESNQKVIVFVPFTAALNQVRRHLEKRWTVAVVDGSVSPGERKQIFHDFQNSPDPHVLLAHPKTTAHGLTLTAADHTIWYAPIYSLEIFEQANNRMDRPGQLFSMTISMIAASKLEYELYKALRSRQVMQNSVLDLYRQAKDLT